MREEVQNRHDGKRMQERFTARRVSTGPKAASAGKHTTPGRGAGDGTALRRRRKRRWDVATTDALLRATAAMRDRGHKVAKRGVLECGRSWVFANGARISLLWGR